MTDQKQIGMHYKSAKKIQRSRANNLRNAGFNLRWSRNGYLVRCSNPDTGENINILVTGDKKSGFVVNQFTPEKRARYNHRSDHLPAKYNTVKGGK